MKDIISNDDIKGLAKLMIEEELSLMRFKRLMQEVVTKGKFDGQTRGSPNIEQSVVV